MEQRKYFNPNGEFSPTGEGIFYPAYMLLEDLQNFAFAYAHQILQQIIYAEVKVKTVAGRLGLDWEIEEFPEDGGDKKTVALADKHSFILDPSWKIIGFRDQWFSMPYTPRCQETEEGNIILQKLTDRLLGEIAEKYSNLQRQPNYNHKFLKNGNLTNILTLSLRSFGQQPIKKDRLTHKVRKFADDLRKKK